MPPTDRDYYTAFRARLVALRTDLGWSQQKMATALDMPLANYKKYEVRSKFPLHKIEKLALATHQSIEFVVTGKNAKPARLRAVS